MLTRPLTLNDSDDRGRSLVAVTPPPVLPLADEGDDDDETQTGVFSPAPPWSSSSSSPSSPPCASSSSSAPSFTLPPPAHLSSTSFSTPPVFLLSPPPSSLSPLVAPLLSSAGSPPPLPPSLHSSPPAPPGVSSTAFISPSRPVSPPFPPLAFCSYPSSCPPPPPISIIPAPSVSPPPSSHFSPLSSSPPPVPPSLLSPPPLPTAPSLLPPAPPPCCPCSSLLPRLLSAHRLEVRRLLRGALASLGRRLDSLERRSRRKKKSKKRGGEEGACSSPPPPGQASSAFSSASSCNSAHRPSLTSSSSSDGEDSATPPLSSSVSQSERRSRRRSRGEEEEEEEEEEGSKRRRKNHRGREGSNPPGNQAEDEEEEDAGRFVGRMAVSIRGGAEEEEEEAPLTLHNFIHRKYRRREEGGNGQSEKAVSVVRRNGYRAPALHGSSSQNALLQSAQRGPTCSQSEGLSVSSGQWRFSDLPLPLPLSSNHAALHIWLCSAPSSFSHAPMLRLSAVAVETMSETVRGGASWSPQRPLKDWTAPPSLSSDHCYVRTATTSPTLCARRQQKQRTNHSSRSLHLPRRRPLPLPPCSANGLSAPFSADQSAAGSKFLSTNGERGKRVSQIRIRRAPPRETLLTPMGLPKVKRLKKKEFSLEEIYTNKNYKSPSTNRSLETIFEEPREKDGALLLIGQQRRRRLLLFPDFTQPRKRKKPQGAGLPVATLPRKRAAARRHCHGGSAVVDESDLDVMLVERLSALEDFLTRQGLDV
ncbi:proton channel OtopLc isoform X2 [Dicentrarchus labrax]|uniref:proton channel OtopLc isoform X2 n=1 Tax=Dicentrarchus labrax TaxID=13489 RepID=UPI0021F61967|nr:proton channel OtopLc isoform X2 [Dicentrarchus labrax]